MAPKIAKIRRLGKGCLLLSVENPIISSMETVHCGYQNRLKPVHAIALFYSGWSSRITLWTTELKSTGFNRNGFLSVFPISSDGVDEICHSTRRALNGCQVPPCVGIQGAAVIGTTWRRNRL
jgi:hypothetical protein